MIVTVSTAKDTLENIRFFVGSNLANGVDHMVIFLEAPEEDTLAWLTEHPHVTCVPADRRWWNGKRPTILNRRQLVNANATKEVLDACDWSEWLFHIDADEVALIDRDALDALPPTSIAVRLPPCEAVSVRDAATRPTLFKRLLTKDELSLLTALGLLAEPTNSLHFRSHIVGKVGVRTAVEVESRRGDRKVWLRHHRALTSDGITVDHDRADGASLLHYESWSGAEFVRKWSAMVGSGPAVNFGQYRQVISDGIRSLLASGRSEAVTAQYLARLYELHMADRVDVLDELGFLIEAEPERGPHTPQALTPEQSNALASGLADLAGADKARFRPPAVASAPPPSRRARLLGRRTRA